MATDAHETLATRGQRLRQTRKARGLTQLELTALTGINNVQICRFEYGRGGMNASTLASLADALGVTMDYLWRGTEATP